MSVSKFELLTVEIEAPIARIILGRPERLNALSPGVLEELIAAASTIEAAGEVNVVIVRGAGRAFSSGFDLDAATRTPPTSDQVDLGRRMADAVSRVPALTIAAIHGHCVGGGLVLAAACDIRIAAEGTRFAVPEVDFGIPLAWGGIPRLVRELGPAYTKELVLTCRPFTAAEAQALRFLNRVVPTPDLDREVESIAASIATKPRFLIRHTKQLVNAMVENAYPTSQS
ncbi:MAG TPA: enoyl-CoA hydratase/isomerase family protein, partial [Solirubrobacteraceae bacterium]|nr:enoyl-CoA hydratase/isomerase family protein [Solirubrobacteraceae bacterium]